MQEPKGILQMNRKGKLVERQGHKAAGLKRKLR
jgi:hypothetical protein